MAEKIENYWFIGKTSENEDVWKFAARSPRDGLPAGVQYVRDEDIPVALRPDTDGVLDVWISLSDISSDLIRVAV